MGFNVSSWFIDQLKQYNSSPKLRFTLNNSDHSSRVVKWPSVKVDVEKIAPSNALVTLTNADGLYTDLYSDIYSINRECLLEFGFTHPTSGGEFYTMYKGKIKKVSFQDQANVQLNIYNKFYDISKIKIGQSGAPASFTAQIPSDIAWTICTSYAGLSSVESTSNEDLDYNSFLRWAASFSADSVTAEAYFDGERISEALQIIAKQTDSFIFVNEESKIFFERFSENSSLDITFSEGEYSKLKIQIDGTAVINKQSINFNYSVTSDYWEDIVTSINSTSINSFGLQEEISKSENFWFVDSVDAITQADRVLSRWSTPPRKFDLTVPLWGIYLGATETLRFVNSFFNVNSSEGWRISKKTLNLSPNKINLTYQTNEGFVADAFYLDIHSLDGEEQLL